MAKTPKRDDILNTAEMPKAQYDHVLFCAQILTATMIASACRSQPLAVNGVTAFKLDLEGIKAQVAEEAKEIFNKAMLKCPAATELLLRSETTIGTIERCAELLALEKIGEDGPKRIAHMLDPIVTLVMLGHRFRNTNIVDEDFPRIRDEFDEALRAAVNFIGQEELPDRIREELHRQS